MRNAGRNDIEGIMLIEHESFHENITENRDIFLDRIGVFPEGFLVLEIDEEIAGYISSEIWEYSENISTENFNLNHAIADVHRNTGSQLYISSIGILKRYRGKGYGSMLFTELSDRITSRYDISCILLIVSVDWKAARKIYENRGFKEIQRIQGFFDDNTDSEAIVMRKYV